MMKRIQVAVGLLAAIATGVIARSASVTIAVSVATLTFFSVVWIWATVGRVRYWRPRGGRNSEQCPNCKAQRHRLGGDWILECKKCGWRAGWPFLRHITHGVIGAQAQRTVSARGAFLVGAATALILTGGSTISDGNLVPESLATGTNILSALEQIGLAVIGLLLMLLVIYLITRPSNKWCEDCGFDVGTDPPDQCPNCGFNVFTEDKPPAGGVKAIKHVGDDDKIK